MIKSLSVLLASCCLYLPIKAQYWQQKVDYIIDVTLNDNNHSLDGFEKLTYSNHSPDTLFFIWFHLWPNAYKNDQTAFSEQLLTNGRTDFYFSNREERGYINRLDFKVDGITAQTTDDPYYIDIIKLVLPTPLPPGGQIMIATPFHVELPSNFSRGGHTGDSYQVTQWFPKPAVFDRKGWHPIPYLDQGEFYSEIGNYDVRITVPANYVVAATGELQNEEEKKWLQTRSSFSWTPARNKTVSKKGTRTYTKKIVQLYPLSSTTTKTLQFKQENVHDFAWFADKRYIVNQDTVKLSSGRIINAYSYYLPKASTPWKNSIDFIKKAIHYRSALLGEYPFATVSAVEAKMGVDGGMEYPTITCISSAGSSAELEDVIEHEVGHNWLQGILATNERQYPWMDEGFNTYYDNRYKGAAIKGAVNSSRNFFGNKIPANPEHVILETLIADEKDQPINTSSEKFTEVNYGMVAYGKAGEWMQLLENRLGTTMFDSCMHEYYRRWQFRHPYPEDFKEVITSVSGKNTDDLFQLLDKKGDMPPLPEKKQIKPVAFFNFSNTDRYSYINIMPALGYNQYDQLLIGGLIHNYNLPASKFQFLAAPLYGTGSSQFNWLARAAYHWFPTGILYKAEIGVASSRFSTDEYQPPGADKIVLGFIKVVPFIRVTFKQKNPLSKTTSYLQFKTYFIKEDAFDFQRVITPTDTFDVVGKKTGSRYINQLKWVIDNKRALYPFNATVQAEQAADFVRTTFTGNYFFNYSNQQGGMNVRLFAGKFFYNGVKTFGKQFDTDRYHFNLTGANGYEDYTYSDYFLGRNKFDGLASQQIMMRDGFFKVRTDLLSDKIGKTDDWLSAINLTSDVPKNINPLSILPIKLPLKVFADIGTYAQAWQQNAPTSRFLFDAGLQLSLLKGTVNIYFPILYSKEYRDYFNSTLGKNHFWKTVSFSIDIHRFSLSKLNSNLNF